MHKFLKITVIVFGVLIGLLILSTVILRMAFPPAKLRRLVEDQIRQQLNREAQIGEVRLDIRGLSLSRIKLSEVPSFSAGTFLAVDETDVHWTLLPLLFKQIVIKEILLEKPQINLIRMADGKTYNISDLAGPTQQQGLRMEDSGQSRGKSIAQVGSKRSPQSSAPGPGSTWPWRVNEIHLLHGTIRFDDRSPAEQTSALSDIELIIRDFDPTHAQGRLNVGHLQNPVYTARDFSAEWVLHDIDPTLGHLNGWLHLKQGPGLIQNLTSLVNSSKGAKLALMPLVMLQNLDRLGIVRLGLPNFSHLTITQITGDYGFKDGTMKIKTFEIVGPQLSIGTSGAIELASGKLAMDVSLNTPKPVLMGEMNLKMHISGTLSNPQTNLDSLKKKAFKATIKQLQDNPGVQKNINDALKNIFH